LNEQASGKRLSKQTHAIIPKILAVDRLITPPLQARIREAHRRSPSESSAVSASNTRRRQRFDPEAERLRLGRGYVAMDDLLDAAICLVAATRIVSDSCEVFGDQSFDQKGLRMEIVA
jgi:predicted RNase H-like nuclease